MANGNGWLDCLHCKKCDLKSSSWDKRYCKHYLIELPDRNSIDYQHTVCAKFEEREALIFPLNGEVIPREDGGGIYLIYRRTKPHYESKAPQHMEDGVLYGFHYSEQILRPLLTLP